VGIKLHAGDALEHLKSMEAESVDSLITDPPAGISFMGKAWDSGNNFIPSMTEVFKDCLRVLKPGAHGLVWALPRTSHWTATALENAGFEIRDVITHIFGSGFPKSLDISKAIDKHKGITEWKETTPNPAFRPRQLEHDTKWDTRPTPPKPIVESEEAKKWQGFGTALKPASEHWILIRKPLSEKTVAANVLKYGTGGINIDASRISLNGEKNPSHSNRGANFNPEQASLGRFPANLVLSHNEDCEPSPHVFPDGSTASGCTDDCAVKMLDEQSGVLKQGGAQKGAIIKSKGGGYGCLDLGKVEKQSGIIGEPPGGASRFFYCAKASKKDRAGNNSHPTVKSTKLMEYLIKLITPPEGIVLDPFMGSGSTGVAAKRFGFRFMGIEKEQDYFEIAEKRIGA
jgi:hypothetical protein